MVGIEHSRVKGKGLIEPGEKSFASPP